MPLTLVQAASGVSAANVTSQSAVFPGTPTSGNLLLCAVNSDATVSTPSGWTLVVSKVNLTGLYLFGKIAGASESATVTVAPTSSASTELRILEYSGQLAGTIATVIDKTASGTNGSAATGTTAATAQADELAVALCGVSSVSGTPSATWNNSFVAESTALGAGTTNTGMFTATRALSATGTVTTTATLVLSGSTSGALVATFKAAAGGTTQVSATRAINYAVQAAVAATRRVNYGVLANVAATRAVVYGVTAAVIATRRVTYNVQANVASTRRVVYNVAAGTTQVAATRRIAYTVTAQVSATRKIRYDVQAAVLAQRRVVYDVTKSVAATRRVTYSVQAPIVAPRTIRYVVGDFVAPTAIAQSIGLRYGVIAPDVPTITRR